MLPEISLNILDISQNSIKAGAKLIEILVEIDRAKETLLFEIRDNGCGMNEEQVTNVVDPFFTSRTTRKVGLGIPFLKQAAEGTGGEFSIQSKVGVGTTVSALFHTDNIDCMPLGDITETIWSIVTMNDNLDFVYTYRCDGKEFQLDTREIRNIVGDISFSVPEVSSFIKDFLKENKQCVDKVE
ncbi:MAG: ATP-binding protein [Clostridia bacterium]|nr:ATP-binding protein [Clostridia bacterium]